MQKQTNVLVVCPDCLREYVQAVTGEFVGPRKRVPNYKAALQETARGYGQTFDRGEWVGLMRCAECSLRQCPPVLQPVLRHWLEHGEVKS